MITRPLIIISFLLVFVIRGYAQYTIQGPNPATVGNSYQYTCKRTSGIWTSPSTVWSTPNGTVVTSTVDPSDKTTTRATILWTSSYAGDPYGEISFNLMVSDGTASGSANIMVQCGTLPADPAGINVGLCAPGAITLSATTSNARWYSNSTSTVPLATGHSYTTPALSARTHYYYSNYDAQTRCESSGRGLAVVDFYPVPSAPGLLNPVAICGTGGSAFVNLAPDVVGNSVTVYDAATQGNVVSVSNSFITGNLTAATTYYAVSKNQYGCESTPRTPIVINQFSQVPIPSAPAPMANQSVCAFNFIQLTGTSGANGNSIAWFTGPNATPGYVGSGTNVQYGLKAGTVTFSPRTTNAQGCISAPGSVTVTGNAPGQSDQRPFDIWSEVVYGHGQVDLAAYVSNQSYGPIKWYDQEVGGTLLGTGATYTTPDLTGSSTQPPPKYYVATTDPATGCQFRQEVVVDLRPLTPAIAQTIDHVRVSGVVDDPGVDDLNNSQRTTTMSYIDGMLRTTQQTVRMGSPNGKDMTIAVEYLNNGNDTKQYLPFVSNRTDGSFSEVYKTVQSSFYTATNDKIINDNYPFAIDKTEDSPLGRVVERGAPGQFGQLGSGHTATLAYGYNTGATASEAEEVRRFNTDGTSAGFYAVNTLNRTESTDENGNKILMFTDGTGNVIVKKIQLDEVINGVTVNYLQTYNIYDDFGRVIYIISPKGVATLRTNGWSFTQAIKDYYTTQFLYDYRGRVVEKKTPGQAVIYYIYDKMNRLALTQDGLLRASNSWLYMKYDYKGRPIMNGVYVNTTQTTRATMQTMVDGLYLSGNTTYPVTAWYETRGTTLHGYSNVSFPKTNDDAGKTAIQVLSVSYFESYDFDYNGIRDYKYDSTAYTGQSNWSNYLAKDLPTGNKRLVLGTSNWLYSYVFYDDRGRAIQIRTNNHLSATVDNLMTAIYDFEGKVLSVKNYHNAGAGKQSTVINKYDYDTQGRVRKIYQNNNGAVKDQLLVAYEYNELGQLVDKKLHGDDPVTPTSYLQSIDLRYNIFGQLQSINNAQLVSDGVTNDESNDFFGMELAYNANIGIGNVPQYDGKMSAVVWKSPGAATGTTKDEKSYLFTYDKADKLKSSVSQMNDGTSWNKELNALNETATYDHNGNILSLTRNQRLYQITGKIPTYGAETIDNLTYSYDPNIGDRLLKITDAATGTSPTSGFDNGTSSANNDYTYDTNGNLLTDANKGITGNNIVYNILGKPTTIQFSDGRRVEYVYDASGAKLTMKAYTVGGFLQTTTDYVDRFVYMNGTLSFFGCPEGRVANNAGTLEYQYTITDHQGNTRILFTSASIAPTVSKATFETDESAQFNYYPVSGGLKNTQPTNNSTPGGTNSQHLNGGNNAAVGVSHSYSVYPGDQLKIEAYARYDAPAQTPSGLSGFAANLLSAFSLSPPAGGEVGTQSAAISSYGGWEAGGYANGTNDQTDPKAFVTILLFDKNYNFLDVTYDQVKSSGGMVYISANYTVKEAGYAYMYISNENPYLTDVYFDDITMTYTPTRVIQYNEYYPYGLQANTSWTRGNTTNNFKYNGASELNVTTGWYDLPYRNYDPAIGRFVQVDPLAYQMPDMSPYEFAGDNPILFNDPSGLKLSLKGIVNKIKSWFVGDGTSAPKSQGENASGGGSGGSGGGTATGGTGSAGSAAAGDTFSYIKTVDGVNYRITVTSNGDGTYSVYANNEDANSEQVKLNVTLLGPVTATAQGDASDNFYFIDIDKESDAYKFMLAVQNLPNGKGREVIGVLSINQKTGKKGVLILPWSDNGPARSDASKGYHKTYYEDYDGVRYTPLALIHTHAGNEVGPDSWGDEYEGDLEVAPRLFPQLPWYVLGQTNYVQFYPSRSRPGSTYDLTKDNNPVSLFPK